LLVGEVFEVDEDCWLVAALGLRDVVVDECLECGVAVFFEAAFDEERAATAYGGVGDTDDAVDALSVEDPFAGSCAVAAELDTLADAATRAGGGGHRVLLLLVGGEYARHQEKAMRAVKPMIQ
jgi:hypothetical protein